MTSRHLLLYPLLYTLAARSVNPHQYKGCILTEPTNFQAISAAKHRICGHCTSSIPKYGHHIRSPQKAHLSYTPLNPLFRWKNRVYWGQHGNTRFVTLKYIHKDCRVRHQSNNSPARQRCSLSLLSVIARTHAHCDAALDASLCAQWPHTCPAMHISFSPFVTTAKPLALYLSPAVCVQHWRPAVHQSKAAFRR